MERRSRTTRHTRWNFCCCEILLYLQNSPLRSPTHYIQLYHTHQQPPTLNTMKPLQSQRTRKSTWKQDSRHPLTPCQLLSTVQISGFYCSLFPSASLPVPLPYKQNYPPMKQHPHGTHDHMVRQFMAAAKIPSRSERGQVRELFKQKLSQHIGMLQHHQLREDRFALAHQLALQKHNDSALRAKEFLQLRQNKALANKSHSLLERSRRAEGAIEKWENIVDKNRKKYEQELQQAKTVIKLWNEKLAESTTRKTSHLEGLSKELKLKQEQREKRIMTLRLKGELSPVSFNQNPEQMRSLKSSRKQSFRKQSRVSTQSFLERRRQEQEVQLKESIMRSVGKEQRINQARYMRHYYQQKRRKQQLDKDDILKALRDNKLNALRDSQEQRNQLIEKRISKDISNRSLSKDRSKEFLTKERDTVGPLDQSPPPKHRGTQSLKAVFSNYQHESPRQQQVSPSPNRNYTKLMTEKLRQISGLMRKERKVGKH